MVPSRSSGPSGADLTADFAAGINSLIATALAAAVTDNTETGITVDYDTATGKFNFVVTSMQGGGGSDDGVIDGFAMTDDGAVTITRTVGADLVVNIASPIRAIITAVGYLTAISSDASLTGEGTDASPLEVTNPFTAADELKLDGIDDGATDVEVQDVLNQILAGTNITIDRATLGEITISAAGGATADGVIDGISLANTGTVTVSRSVGTDLTANFATGINALIDAAVTRLTLAEVEDETNTSTDGVLTPAILAHAIEVHQSVFMRDEVSSTGTLTSSTYSLTVAGTDRPVKFPEGSLVYMHAPTHTGFGSNPARVHVNVGEAGASDDVTAVIRQLDGGGSHSWEDFTTGRHYLLVYLNGAFWPLDLTLLVGSEVDARVLDLLADAVTGNTETGITVTLSAGKLNFVVTGGGGGGSTLRFGSGTPADTLGEDGDAYLDTDCRDILSTRRRRLHGPVYGLRAATPTG